MKKKNFVRGLPSLSSTMSSSSSSSSSSSLSSSSSFMSLVWKYLLVIFLLIEHGRTDMEEINNDPIALLEKYLKYCRTIYDTYKDEIKLGYCWIDYLLGTNDVRSDFISNIIENELMQLSNDNLIDNNCDNNSKYCNKYLSYNDNDNNNNNNDYYYSEHDVNVNSSNDKQYYNDNNVTTEKNLNDTFQLDITKRAMINHQIDNLNNQSSNVVSSLFNTSSMVKRKRRHNERKNLIESYNNKLGNPYRRYFFLFEPKVLTLLKKKLEQVRNESLYLNESDNLLNVLRLFILRRFSDHDNTTTQESSYLNDTSSNGMMLKIDENYYTNDWKKDIQTIWSSLSDNYKNMEDKVRARDLISLRKNLKTRNKRSVWKTINDPSIFITVYKTLTEIFRMGQLVTEIVDSSNVLKCTKDYLSKKFIKYIDSL